MLPRFGITIEGSATTVFRKPTCSGHTRCYVSFSVFLVPIFAMILVIINYNQDGGYLVMFPILKYSSSLYHCSNMAFCLPWNKLENVSFSFSKQVSGGCWEAVDCSIRVNGLPTYISTAITGSSSSISPWPNAVLHFDPHRQSNPGRVRNRRMWVPEATFREHVGFFTVGGLDSFENLRTFMSTLPENIHMKQICRTRAPE